MNNNVKMLLDEELSNILKSNQHFKNESIFSKEYIPDKLLFREKQYKDLIILFKDIFNVHEQYFNYFKSATLVGPNGCGKSNLAKIFCLEFVKELNSRYENQNFIYRHINCRRNGKVYLALFDLLRSLIPHFPNRGFSSNELLNMLHISLINSNSYLFLVLDEVDHLFKNSDVDILLNNLSFNQNLASNKETKRISVIFITRNKDFLLLLNPDTRFGILDNIIPFNKLSKIQIKEILLHRCLNGLNDGVIELKLLDEIAIVIEESNDIRYGIELLWRSIKISENQNSSSVKMKHLETALKQTKDFSKHK